MQIFTTQNIHECLRFGSYEHEKFHILCGYRLGSWSSLGGRQFYCSSNLPGILSMGNCHPWIGIHKSGILWIHMTLISPDTIRNCARCASTVHCVSVVVPRTSLSSLLRATCWHTSSNSLCVVCIPRKCAFSLLFDINAYKIIKNKLLIKCLWKMADITYIFRDYPSTFCSLGPFTHFFQYNRNRTSIRGC